MTKRSGTAAAIAAALAVPIALTGCSTGASSDDAAGSIESALLAVDHVTGAYVGFTSSGPDGEGILVNLYVDSDQLDDLVSAADGGLRAAWQSSPTRPAFVHLAIAPVEKPKDPLRLEPAAIDPSDVAAALDIDGATVVRQLIMVEASDLERHYGAREESAE